MSKNTISTNHLAGSTSPYLLQHLHNPVDWYPWGDEPFEKAKREDKPVFLSVGYATCHWCHVMAHRCFENEEIAAYLNEHFVSIKVDREVRPDLDAYYMSAVQAMNQGRGGWPMTLFLTPDKEVIFAGTTYLEDTFPQLLRAVVDGWENRRGEITSSAAEITRAISGNRDISLSGSYGKDVLSRYANEKKPYFDAEWGGWGGAPKFPDAMGMMLLLRHYEQSGDEETLEQVKLTLRKMAMGGVYDQVGGGFHRYSTDGRWFLPHFEKMLYDNALLAITLLETARLSGDDFYLWAAKDTLHFLEREILLPNGGFACAYDADSEGVEGKFYMWEATELKHVLGVEDASLISTTWNIKPDGNYTPESILEAEFARGQNVPWRTRPWDELAEELRISENELIARVEGIRDKLYKHRAERAWPLLDDKQLVSWNALAIIAFARAYAYNGDDYYLEIAETAFDSIYGGMMIEGELYHARRGDTVHVKGMLEDYAGLLKAAVDLYRVTGDERYLEVAQELADASIERFYDETDGGFFNVAADTSDGFARDKPITDGVQPSGNSLMAVALFQLGHFTGSEVYTGVAEQTLKTFGRLVAEQPMSVVYLLNAADIAEDGFTSIEVVGDKNDPKIVELLNAARRYAIGESVLLSRRDPTQDETDNAPFALICAGKVCHPPVYDVNEIGDLVTP